MAHKPLNKGDITRFLVAHRMAGCPGCGSKNFDVHNEVEANSRMASIGIKFPGFDIQAADVVELVLLSCQHCARASFYVRKPIADWIQSHPTG